MANTALASVTRLPTAAPRKVRNPSNSRCAALVVEQHIPKLPRHWQKKAAERAEVEQLLQEYIAENPERWLVYSILRAMPGWQARNVRRLAGLEGGDHGFAARLISAAAVANSIAPDTAR